MGCIFKGNAHFEYFESMRFSFVEGLIKGWISLNKFNKKSDRQVCASVITSLNPASGHENRACMNK